MGTAVRCDVEQAGTFFVVHLAGELTLAAAPAVRQVLLKCLVEQPEALLIEVRALTVRERSALSVLTAVARHASLWPGTPLLVCSPPESIAVHLLARGGYGRLPVFDSITEAMEATPSCAQPAVADILLPVSGAARRAREMVTQACGRWGLPHLVDPASIVASELVANAVVHASTMMDLRLSLRRRYLMIAVRDGSPDRPRPVAVSPLDRTGGRGLLLVNAIARRWGCLRTDGGKVVWAAIDLNRRAGSPPSGRVQ